MNPLLSIFTLLYPFSLGIKGGVCFEKEGLFRPSFFIEERRIFMDKFVTPINTTYDSVKIFTKSNSLGIILGFYNKEYFVMMEGSYTNLFQVYDIFRKYEYIKSNKAYEGFNIAFLIGKNLKKIYIATGFDYLSIIDKIFFKIETGFYI